MIEQLILDIKGVLYNETEKGKEATYRAADFINYLREKKLPFVLGTNTTTEIKEDIVADLSRIGLNFSPNDITSCIELSASYLSSEGIGRVFLITDNPKLRQYYQEQGFKLVDYDSQAVVVGLDRELKKETMKKAADELMEGAKLIGLHRYMIRVNNKGEAEPNVGKIVEDLEKAAGIDTNETIIIGKPSKIFYDGAIKRLPSQNPRVTLMVDDDPKGGLETANLMGMQTAFVRSPKYKEWPAEMNFKPNYNVGDLGELVGKV